MLHRVPYTRDAITLEVFWLLLFETATYFYCKGRKVYIYPLCVSLSTLLIFLTGDDSNKMFC